MNVFAVNVMKVLRGTIVAQVILFAAMPVMTRMFSPADFGTVQAMQSVLTLLLVCTVLRLEVAILSETEGNIKALLSTCVWVCFITSGAVLVVVVAWEAISGAGETSLGVLIYVLPVSMLAAGLGLVFSYLMLRIKLFDTGANAKIAQAIVFSGSAVGVGAFMPTALGLGLADLCGKSAFCLSCLRKNAFAKNFGQLAPNWSVAAGILRRHRQLVYVSLPGAAINVLGSSYTPMMLLMIFGANEAGHYALIERVVGGPVGMIAGAVSQVFMAGFSEVGRLAPTSQRVQFRNLLLSQFRLAIIPACLFFVSAPMLIPLIFGAEWALAGTYAQAMTPLFLTSFVVGPVNMALTISGYQRLQLLWDIGRLTVVGGVWFFVFNMQVNSLHALWIYCVAAVFCFGAYILIADIALGRAMKSGAPA